MIKQALTYKDEKSDKFWRMEQLESAFVVNYGKTGTTGKYEIKEFDDEAEAIKQAEKLAAQKLKKGYVENPAFDYISHWYYDDEETGPHPLTSHPHFREHFTDEFYYDCCDEEAPFGSDEGSDALYIIGEKLRKKPDFDFAGFPRYIVEDEWDMSYIPVDTLDEAAVRDLLERDEMNVIQSDMITYAAAFAQIKIMGKLDAGLRQGALDAMERYQVTALIQEWGEGRSPQMDQMIRDLAAFKGVY